MKQDNPSWWPEQISEEWIREIREDYDDVDFLTDDELIKKYNNNYQFLTYWDTLFEARNDWDKLANAFLLLHESIIDAYYQSGKINYEPNTRLMKIRDILSDALSKVQKI